MTPIQRYELIRPILHGLKTVLKVHQETKVATRTLYRYIKRFREGSGQLQSLADDPSGPRIHPNWFTEAQKAVVIDYKKAHRDKSARQIAIDLTEAKILSISDHSVADILKQRGMEDPPFSINPNNSRI